jgi:hypothetical protein
VSCSLQHVAAVTNITANPLKKSCTVWNCCYVQGDHYNVSFCSCLFKHLPLTVRTTTDSLNSHVAHQTLGYFLNSFSLLTPQCICSYSAIFLKVSTPSTCPDHPKRSLCLTYRYAPHNHVSVNDGPHIRRWSHNIIIPQCYSCLQYSAQ